MGDLTYHGLAGNHSLRDHRCEQAAVGGSPCVTTATPTPCIRIDGTSAGNRSVDGLNVNADHVTIKGLAITRFSSGIQVSGSNDTIALNYLGTFDGSTGVANSYGVYLGAAANHVTIGGTTAADRNVISGNVDAGIEIKGTLNYVFGNYIGTNAAGTTNVGDQGSGVDTTAEATSSVARTPAMAT